MFQSELTEIKRDLTGEISKILLSNVIGTGPAGSLFSVFVSSIVKYRDDLYGNKNIKKRIDGISSDICEVVLAGYRQEGKSHRIGTAISGLRDFQKTIQLAGLTIDTIINLELDPEAVQLHLQEFEPKHLENETTHQRQVVHRACEEFSRRIINIVPLLPEFQVVVFRTILKKQNEILSNIVNSK